MTNQVISSIIFCFLFFIEGIAQDYSAMLLLHPLGEEKKQDEINRFYLMSFQRTTSDTRQKLTFAYFDEKILNSEEGSFTKSFLVVPRFYFIGDTNSFNIGFLVLKNYNSEFPGLVSPVGGYERKLSENFYASIDLLDDDLPAYYSLSLGYKPDIKNFELRFGFSKQEEKLYHIKLKYTLLNLFPFSFNYGYKYPVKEHVFYLYFGIKV